MRSLKSRRTIKPRKSKKSRISRKTRNRKLIRKTTRKKRRKSKNKRLKGAASAASAAKKPKLGEEEDPFPTAEVSEEQVSPELPLSSVPLPPYSGPPVEGGVGASAAAAGQVSLSSLDDASLPSGLAAAAEPASTLSLSGYTDLNLLGEGSFGQVWSVINPGGERVAIKKISAIDEYVGKTTCILREIIILKRLNEKTQHPNIIRCINIYTDDDVVKFTNLENIYIEMEKADYTLENIIHSVSAMPDVSLPPKAIYICMYQLFCGLHYMHSENVIHRDIKPANLLIKEVDGHRILKICDFGISRIFIPPESRHRRAAKILAEFSTSGVEKRVSLSLPTTHDEDKMRGGIKGVGYGEMRRMPKVWLEGGIAAKNLEKLSLAADVMALHPEVTGGGAEGAAGGVEGAAGGAEAAAGGVEGAQGDKLSGWVVTRYYRPPELRGEMVETVYNFSIDIWSAACIMAELSNGKILFQGSSDQKQYELTSAIAASPETVRRDDILKPMLPGLDPIFIELLTKIFQKNIGRPNAGEAMDHLNTWKDSAGDAASDLEWLVCPPVTVPSSDFGENVNFGVPGENPVEIHKEEIFKLLGPLQ